MYTPMHSSTIEATPNPKPSLTEHTEALCSEMYPGICDIPVSACRGGGLAAVALSYLTTWPLPLSGLLGSRPALAPAPAHTEHRRRPAQPAAPATPPGATPPARPTPRRAGRRSDVGAGGRTGTGPPWSATVWTALRCGHAPDSTPPGRCGGTQQPERTGTPTRTISQRSHPHPDPGPVQVLRGQHRDGVAHRHLGCGPVGPGVGLPTRDLCGQHVVSHRAQALAGIPPGSGAGDHPVEEHRHPGRTHADLGDLE